MLQIRSNSVEIMLQYRSNQGNPVRERKTVADMHGAAERLLVDRIGSDAIVLAVNEAEATALGVPPRALLGTPAAALYDVNAMQRLQRMLAEPGDSGTCVFPAGLTRHDGARLDVMAIAVRGGTAEMPVIDIFKAPGVEADSEFHDLAESNEIMWGIIQAAREAIWCIRYDLPVNVTVPTDEIVDQIFEHPSVWCMCNNAMAKAYGLRDETDLNARNVRFHWPRNAVNEAFIREVIANGFQVDGAISEDYRRDGTPVLMENDVRAHIVEGRLHRLWGTLREVRQVGIDLRNGASDYAALAFELLPLPACLMRPDGALISENAAWRLAFGPRGEVSAKMAFRSAGIGESREIVLPLPLASGETRHHLVTSQWQTVGDLASATASTAYIAVTARLLDDDLGALR
jgi:hypothetical protein